MKEFYQNKKVFITGHTGFKGSWLSNILLTFGADVCGYALAPENNINLYDIFNLKNNMESIIGDIRDIHKLKNDIISFKPDIVFHLAAQPIVRESYVNPVYTYETNVMGTVNLLESVRYCESVKSLLNVTTDKVYENKESNIGYVETDNLCGYDPYSNSKSCSELVTYSFKNSYFYEDFSPAISTARAGNVIGVGDFSKDRIIPDCVRAGFENKKIEIRNPNSVRPYQYVLDSLYGYLLLAQKQYEDKEYAGSYNFGPMKSECITTLELVDKFCKTWGNNLDYIVKNTSSVHEANLLMLDSTKARIKLGWKPKYDINQSIKETAKLYKNIIQTDFISSVTNHIKEFFIDIRI